MRTARTIMPWCECVYHGAGKAVDVQGPSRQLRRSTCLSVCACHAHIHASRVQPAIGRRRGSDNLYRPRDGRRCRRGRWLASGPRVVWARPNASAIRTVASGISVCSGGVGGSNVADDIGGATHPQLYQIAQRWLRFDAGLHRGPRPGYPRLPHRERVDASRDACRCRRDGRGREGTVDGGVKC